MMTAAGTKRLAKRMDYPHLHPVKFAVPARANITPGAFARFCSMTRLAGSWATFDPGWHGDGFGGGCHRLDVIRVCRCDPLVSHFPLSAILHLKS